MVEIQTAGLDARPVTSLRGVGTHVAAGLARLGITTVQDLLFHLPLRYEDRTRVQPIGSLRPGMQVVVEGEVQLTETIYRGRPNLLVRLADGTGYLTLRFFHFTRRQAAALERGVRLRCFGELRSGHLTLELVHPEYRIIRSDQPADSVEEHLTPIYPATGGIQQGRLRNLTTQALQLLEQSDQSLTEWLPTELSGKAEFPSLSAALTYVHRPPPDAEIEKLMTGMHPAQRRLAFEELLAHHLSLRQARLAIKHKHAMRLVGEGRLITDFRQQLGFPLTSAQSRVAEEISQDLRKPQPMTRLIQGDVGCGKTVVAALAVLQAVESGAQAALMAPTELLAEQHFVNFERWFTPLGIPVVWLSGRLKGKARQTVLTRLCDGSAALVVGTHALFQDDVEFRSLGLAVVDEQHRFGVQQRMTLRDKGIKGGLHPHQLIMTATPIPRTLAMTAYADLDISVIDELPPGRSPVNTVVLPESRRASVVARVRQACNNGAQAYWVCPLIEESDLLQCQAAEDAAESLQGALPELTVGLVHGRMRTDQKERVMHEFKTNTLQLLVATTVIEVGVDVPNASLMIIENSERLGLAQLHQLRGRVGRGRAQSTCVLLYRNPLSKLARQRLAAIRETNDGFAIARRDLELRGPGEVLGTRQTGEMQLHTADLMRDVDMLPTVQKAAELISRKYPRRVAPLIRRWMGDTARYADV